ncbi:NADH dehydrogenase subunit 4L (mitochondrion) [Cherax quadricarinatus]|uniref:NADH-ubiquinone oxidoreductase chain 4L n=1 Tax=Cherax quadricarinatus TaxID=27406 RepID=V5LYG0_CHEQU|nr:NADH dehydrogenase subunit 4L [Cherax quadricarinatus]AHA59390.1 NADH dehydrogenase subunit 4L [Cherax quadricarinatus]
MMVLGIEGFGLLTMVFCGFWAFISNHKHLLNVLLSLEFIMLNVFGIMSVYTFSVGLEGVFVMFFLVMVACEGALGLSLLVSIVRSHGNDYFSGFGILVC